MVVANGVWKNNAAARYDIGRRYTRVAMRPATPQSKRRVYPEKRADSAVPMLQDMKGGLDSDRDRRIRVYEWWVIFGDQTAPARTPRLLEWFIQRCTAGSGLHQLGSFCDGSPDYSPSTSATELKSKPPAIGSKESSPGFWRKESKSKFSKAVSSPKPSPRSNEGLSCQYNSVTGRHDRRLTSPFSPRLPKGGISFCCGGCVGCCCTC